MTDPTVDGWTLPEDLSDVALWEGEGGLWCGLEPDGKVAIQSHWDGTTVTADDLLTIAARLTLLAHAINPPAHDPDAEEWYLVCSEKTEGPWVKGAAEADARDFDKDRLLTCGPHRVVHVSELGR